MQTLITGQPGNGKTLYTIVYVKAWAEREGRQVWYHGIKGLKLPWKVIPTQTEKINGEDVEVPQWWLCPAGSIIVIDEGQNCGFGVRQRGMVPEWARKLETHRHLGVDIVFITQDPSLMDAHDRKLCELHFHCVRKFGFQRATIHEFRPVRENVLKSRKGSIEHHWKFPKAAYQWYTSAEAHTHKGRLPLKVWVLGAIVVGLPILCWWAWVRYLDPHRVRPGQALVSGAASAPSIGAAAAGPKWLSTADYLASQTPRVAGLAYTAPVFDEVTKPAHAPYPAACVESASQGCRCYSQQATRLEVPDALCKGIVKGGFFVAWEQPLRQVVPLQAQDARGGGHGAMASAQALEAPVGPSRLVADRLSAPEEPVGRGKWLPKLAAPSNAPF